MDQEVQGMLRKGAISIVEPVQEQFLSSILLLKKWGGSCGRRTGQC